MIHLTRKIWVKVAGQENYKIDPERFYPVIGSGILEFTRKGSSNKPEKEDCFLIVGDDMKLKKVFPGNCEISIDDSELTAGLEKLAERGSE